MSNIRLVRLLSDQWPKDGHGTATEQLKKLYIYPFNPFFFFIFLTGKCFEIFPQHSGYCSISDSFALNWYIFVTLINK